MGGEDPSDRESVVKVWQVDVAWTFVGGQLIEAETEEEAREIAGEKPLSSFNGSYVADSFEIDCVDELADDDEVLRDEKRGTYPGREDDCN